jgi:adenosyl cobinamide kinase/adenosyl cobinamide phosphate guanylyltransferase
MGSATMNAIDCFSSSFCAIVDSKGNVRIANTEAKIEELAGWKTTDVDGTTALHGVSCTSTQSCIAVDSIGNMLSLTIESTGAATASKIDIDGSGDLTAVSCTSGTTCAAVDSTGNVFVSNNKGETWVREHQLTDDLTSVSCASTSLCLAADATGSVTAFDAR